MLSLKFFPVILFFSSCSPDPIDIAEEEQKILNLLQQERKAHFEKIVDLFASNFPPNAIMVNKGKVSQPSVEEFKKRFQTYFNSVEFIKWDDIADPIIRFSADASIAYAIVQKQVIVSYPDSLGKKITDTTDYAWATIYRKQKGNWVGECNISTNK